MKYYYFTPGPSQLYRGVKTWLKKGLELNIPSISHRSAQFQQIFYNTVLNLRRLFNIPECYSVFFLSSATEVMERLIQNCVEKNSFHLITGAFANLFFQTAKDLGKTALKYQITNSENFNLEKIEIPENQELICVTQNETSTGFAISPAYIYQLKKKCPKALVVVDIVSSVPYVNLNYEKIDGAFFSVQKGFGLPAGLGVLIASPHLAEKSKFLSKNKVITGSYHSFNKLQTYFEKNQTPATPNVLNIYLLGKSAGRMLKVDIEKIRKDTEIKAELFNSLVKNSRSFSFFVKNPKFRSSTVFVLKVSGGSDKIIERLKKHGIIAGRGYQQYKKQHIRIANFPAHSFSAVKKLIKLLL